MDTDFRAHFLLDSYFMFKQKNIVSIEFLLSRYTRRVSRYILSRRYDDNKTSSNLHCDSKFQPSVISNSNVSDFIIDVF